MEVENSQVATPSEELKASISRYYEIDAMIKEVTPEKDELNKDIKVQMRAIGAASIQVGDLEASYSSYDKTSLNTDRLMAFLESRGLEHAIKTIRTPDERVVEDLIHQGKIKPEEIQHCVDVKNIETLSVKNKAKKKKSKVAEKGEQVAAPAPTPAQTPTFAPRDYGDTF